MNKIFSKFHALRRGENGFTLAELLVAMLIFGIIVTIAVPMFLNQREANRDNEIKADLLNASLNIESAKSDNGGKFPESKPEGISLNTTTIDKLFYTYPYDRLAYCLQIVSGDKTFFKSSASAEVGTTDCTYEYLVPSTKLTGVMDGFKPVLTWKTVAAATEYVIYKNNIPVKTVTIPAGSAKTSASYTLPTMEPEEQAVYYIVVKDGNTASAQSNSVTLTAPVPPPTEPTIKIAATEPSSSTKQQYTIQWSAIRYASGYEVWDVSSTPSLITTLGKYDTSYKYTNQRGTSNKIAVKAKNAEGTSPLSNSLNLESVWPEAKIISATSNPDTGKMNFVFQEDKDGTFTPDWGTPDHKITLKIVQTSNGSVVFNQAGITAASYMPNKTFSRVTHTATIVVTTSTGVVLGESSPVTIEFPPPVAPAAVKNFSSDNKGVAPLSPNRAIWDAVTCDDATAEYYLTKGTLNSGWITGTNYEYPAAWLVQGADTTVGIIARCKNGNGTSASTAKTNQTFTVGLMAPEAPDNFTAVNDSNEVKWDAAKCAAGTKAEYRLYQSMKNGSPVENYVDLKTLTYKLPDLFPGLLQTATVQARCVIYVGTTTTVKSASTWSQFGPAYEWETPMPKPDAPVVKLVKKELTSPTEATYTISWGEIAYAQSFSIYNTNDMNVPLLTVGTGTASTTVTLERGTTEDIVVVAKNKSFSSNNSNIVKLSDVWPTPVILDIVPYSYEGTIYVKWQNGTDAAPTPDWGTPGYKVTLDIQNSVTKDMKQFKNLVARDFLTTEELPRDDHTVQIHVTTATGVVLSSAKMPVAFPPPGPPAPVTNLVANSNGPGAIQQNRLQWNAVNCAASDPEYLITNKDGSGNSGWIKATATGSARYYDIPQNWLRQGFNEAFDVAARCVNPAGASQPSANVSTNFNATILTPAAVTGVKNDGIAVVSWNDSTCNSDLTRQYRVVTVKLNGTAQVVNYPTNNSSYTMENLSPWTDQEVYVQVRCYNPANNITSSWSAKNASNTTSWRTPMPVPVAPVIKLDGSRIASATEQEYTISWSAVEWAEGYEAYVGSTRVFSTTDGKVTTAKILRDRGTTSQVILRAKNRAGTSPDSNKVTLANTWPTPVILSAEGSQDGRISYTWQNGTGTNLTPDWGTPGYKVELNISYTSNMASPIYTKTGITATGHTTDVVAATSALRMDKSYYAQIKVTTSTGTVLTSAASLMKFDRPATPANPTGFNSNNQGVGPLKNDRLIWNATTCPTASSVPYYQIYKVTPGTTTITQGISTATPNFVNIPQKYLSQGEETRWRLVTRCQFSNGDYSAWASPYQYHDFTVGVLAPDAPTNVRRDDATTNTIKWNAVTCGAGTTPQYQINKTIHNGAASTLNYTTSALVYDLPSITAGEDQKLTVKARCILTRDTSITSSWSDPSSALTYRAPLPNPAAPVIKEGGTTVSTSKISKVAITWGAIQYAEYYDIYNADTKAKIATVDGKVTTTTVNVNRGSTGTVRVYVVARNFTYTGPQSNTLGLDAPWPAAAVLSVSTNQKKQVTVKWQNSATSPDWGNPDDRVVVYAKQGGAIVYTSTAQTGESMTTAALPNAVDTQIYIKVTTANGEILTSPEVKATFIQPAVPAKVTNVKVVNGTGPINPSRVTWTAITCSVANTTPEYFVRQYVVDSTTTSKNASNWTITATQFDIPQGWLTQGDIYTYGVYSRCVSDNGTSADGGVVQVTAARTNVISPASPANLRLTANNDNGTATIAWNTVSCPTGFYADYHVYYQKKNDVVAQATASDAGTNTTATLTGLTPEKSHSAEAMARCVKTSDTAIASNWSSPRSNVISWTTPLPIPATPVLKLTEGAANDAKGTVAYTLSWAAISWADSYILYDATTGTKLYSGTALSSARTIKKNDTQSFYVVAVNSRGTTPKSNTVKAAPKFDTPVITRTSLDDFTMIASFWFNGAIEATWGTGATAKIVSGTYATQAVGVSSSSARYIGHDRTDRNWYLEVTTIHGDVLKSATTKIDTQPSPVLTVDYDMTAQELNYKMNTTLSTYGLTAATGKWDIQVSNTASFAKTYSQSGISKNTATTTSASAIIPTHAGRYYMRYVLTRTEDGKTLTSPSVYKDIHARFLDYRVDGVRDLLAIDNTNASTRVTFIPVPRDVAAVGSASEARLTISKGGVALPILDFTEQGSQGFLYYRSGIGQGTLYYYAIQDDGVIAPAVTLKTDWNVYDEIVVVQNFFGDDKPAIVAIRTSNGKLDFWKSTSGTGLSRESYSQGSGWGRTDAVGISELQPVYGWNGFDSVGFIAAASKNPFVWYYGSNKNINYTGVQNVKGGASMATSWDTMVKGISVNYPTTSNQAACCSWVRTTSYPGIVRGGIVSPIFGVGPNNYLDVAIGTGNNGFETNGLGLNWAYANNTVMKYQGQGTGIAK